MFLYVILSVAFVVFLISSYLCIVEEVNWAAWGVGVSVFILFATTTGMKMGIFY